MANSQDEDLLFSPYFSVTLHLGETGWDKWTILLFSQSKCLSCKGSNRERRCLGFDPHACFQASKTSPDRSCTFIANLVEIGVMVQKSIKNRHTLFFIYKDERLCWTLSVVSGIFDVHNISDMYPIFKHCVYQIYTRKWTVFNIHSLSEKLFSISVLNKINIEEFHLLGCGTM
jgi:hypothetical protein